MNKTCNKCGEEKPLDCFYHDKRWKGGPRAEWMPKKEKASEQVSATA